MLLKIQVSELMFKKQDERMKTGQKVQKMTETNNFNDLELELSNINKAADFFVSDINEKFHSKYRFRFEIQV